MRLPFARNRAKLTRSLWPCRRQQAIGSGRSVVWLARLFRVQEVGSSNLPAPTIFLRVFATTPIFLDSRKLFVFNVFQAYRTILFRSPWSETQVFTAWLFSGFTRMRGGGLA